MSLALVVPAISHVLKDGAAGADFTWIGSVVTVLCLAVFVAWIVYALQPSRRRDFEDAARLPFDDLDGGAR